MKNKETNQLAISRRRSPSYDTFFGCHNNRRIWAADRTNVPPTQVLQGFGVHVGLSTAPGLAPQEDPQGTRGNGEGRSAEYLFYTTIVSIKELNESGYVLILRFSMTKPAISTESPWERPLLGIDNNLEFNSQIKSMTKFLNLFNMTFIYLIADTCRYINNFCWNTLKGT